MQLETLYKTATSGATQVLNMEITGDTYTRTWGQLDGKQQTKATTASPKNIGRANETTAEEQAIIEAKAVWVKKQKANYSTSIAAPVVIELPMKVNVYQKHKKKVVFPCYISPKLNGVNAEYRLDRTGTLSLLSRGGEQYPIPSHQIEGVMATMAAMGVTRLNGEMYSHGQHLQDIMAATKKHNELTKDLVFNTFDLPTVKESYSTRASRLTSFIPAKDTGVAIVPIATADSHQDIEDAYNYAMDNGYEGIVIRNADTKYEYNTRSLTTLKYKKTQDAEFEVKSFDIDKNGHPVFHCYINSNHTGANSTFKVKPKGTDDERLEIAANAKSYIGKWIKVAYECFSKAGTPLKPVGICFRKVDADGEAIE